MQQNSELAVQLSRDKILIDDITASGTDVVELVSALEDAGIVCETRFSLCG